MSLHRISQEERKEILFHVFMVVVVAAVFLSCNFTWHTLSQNEYFYTYVIVVTGLSYKFWIQWSHSGVLVKIDI